jgi:UDP-N-acetylmuramoyl-tripeptide--D-alanyl-D-alanine ligase
MNAPVLAITGTNGKTTTKELLAAVLQKKYKVHYTRGNLNNHIGVPLTILSAPADTGFLIIEMGANHPGEIRTLCSIAQPDYGIITNAGTAHLEGFGSLEGVIRTKCELYEHLASTNGTAIYNDQNPILASKVKEIVNRSIAYSNPAGHELSIEKVSTVPLALRGNYAGR